MLGSVSTHMHTNTFHYSCSNILFSHHQIKAESKQDKNMHDTDLAKARL